MFKHEEYQLFYCQPRHFNYYTARTASQLIEKVRTLKADHRWGYNDNLPALFGWGDKELLYQSIYTDRAYKISETATSRPNWGNTPSIATPWQYWDAYYLDKDKGSS